MSGNWLTHCNLIDHGPVGELIVVVEGRLAECDCVSHRGVEILVILRVGHGYGSPVQVDTRGLQRVQVGLDLADP